MDRACGPVHGFGQQVDAHERVRVMVHGLGFGMEYEVGADGFAERDVSVEIAGIGGQILVRGELRRIQEHRHGHAVVFSARAFDQACVSFVQVSHRGNEADRLACATPRSGDRLGVFDGTCDLHDESFFRLRGRKASRVVSGISHDDTVPCAVSSRRLHVLWPTCEYS